MPRLGLFAATVIAALAPREPSDEDRRVATAIERLVATLRRQPRESRR